MSRQTMTPKALHGLAREIGRLSDLLANTYFG